MSVCMCVYFVCTKDRSQGFLQSVVVDGFFIIDENSVNKGVLGSVMKRCAVCCQAERAVANPLQHLSNQPTRPSHKCFPSVLLVFGSSELTGKL